jgi:crossover junction endodeoxyribonuclease RuvC
MKLTTIGIDPGQTGAIACCHGSIITGVKDMPTWKRTHGKGQEVDPYSLTSILMEMTAGKDCVHVYLEQVAAMPGQGVSSTFHFGESVGVILGVCGALQLPLLRITPQYWKKAAGLVGKDKDAARGLAIQRHPEVSDMLTRKKDVGRADAILIAEFGR